MKNILIDTDAGTDDLLAIAFLLARTDITVEAITVVDGLANVEIGAANVARLMTLAGKSIPVYPGSLHSTEYVFPQPWRHNSNNLPGIDLPPDRGNLQKQSAIEFLTGRLTDYDSPAQLLALGPLTNFAHIDTNQQFIRELTIMGGALRVAGNHDQRHAEWNIYVDSEAADWVFSTGFPITLVPLDATNDVPIGSAFLETARRSLAPTLLGRFVLQVLESCGDAIQAGQYYAWDPLAAVSLLMPHVLQTETAGIRVSLTRETRGQTLLDPSRPPTTVAVAADPATFERAFFSAFNF